MRPIPHNDNDNRLWSHMPRIILCRIYQAWKVDIDEMDISHETQPSVHQSLYFLQEGKIFANFFAFFKNIPNWSKLSLARRNVRVVLSSK